VTDPRELTLIRELLDELFPIARSLSGAGNRATLDRLASVIPLKTHEIPCGTEVFDWIVPEEWRIRGGWIATANGERIVDFDENNLHVVGYSIPVNHRLLFSELEPKLHWLPEMPHAIPYRTTYYNKDWGFCVTQEQYQKLRGSTEPLEVVIDSELDASGSLTIGELLIPGRKDDEILVSTYICHPSMANDNLSGVIATTLLAKSIIDSGQPSHTWRFLFVPETIGPIAYVSNNPDIVDRTLGGLVITCCGGPGKLGYKKTFKGNHLVDRAIELAFRDFKIDPERYPFCPTGSDERQYSSPGIRIPVATICKDKYHEYAQYHTSEDNLDFVTPEQIGEALKVYREVQMILDSNTKIASTVKGGEPRLGARGLYPSTGGSNKQPGVTNRSRDALEYDLDAMMWVLFLADGDHDLVDIAETTGVAYSDIAIISNRLEESGLIVRV